jgi:hypothetical protein
VFGEGSLPPNIELVGLGSTWIAFFLIWLRGESVAHPERDSEDAYERDALRLRMKWLEID